MKVYTSDRSRPERVKVGVAEYAVAESEASLVTSGLGSCVGIAIIDPDAGVAGLAHAMLPKAEANGGAAPSTASGTDPETGTEGHADGGRPDEAKYVDTAVPGLLRSMAASGADRSNLEARIAGGSAMFEFGADGDGVGERNVAAAEEVLAAHDIPIVGRDVGGDYGRSLEFDVASGELSVRRAHGETQVL
ncbi:chemotaxis protein CheD [Halobellus marinus]|uniref:chemotaxis protein CheD n=1 Tax=Halobellus TaxID=1073986 RepID=UPI0028A967D0|nr:chemotaxis protein CheD [Halobellus sp. DFY28]